VGRARAGLDRTLRIADEAIRFRIIKLAPGVPPAPDMTAGASARRSEAEAAAPAPTSAPAPAASTPEAAPADDSATADDSASAADSSAPADEPATEIAVGDPS
jgi:hypothetical protein